MKKPNSGTSNLFLREFAADRTNWGPQMRYFSQGHRCTAYSARGYTPSDVPPSKDVYTYIRFYTDALVVLDHLKIEQAHLVGPSMGSYSSLQVGLNTKRALALTFAGEGSGSDLKIWETFARSATRTTSSSRPSAPTVLPRRRARRRAGLRSRTTRANGFLGRAGAARFARLGQLHSFIGRPSIHTLMGAIRKVSTPASIICGDDDDDCIEPSLFLKRHLLASGFAMVRKSGHVLYLEERALFNEIVERFIALVEAGRWLPRDPRSMSEALRSS
ncbi:alpha/beta fold hydrolase [Bradyrhizobium centrosematis]|uniref:alpha/beta fold hydrolase n=1 Tax=Bradyrhizobium centrosematis TaxID=1300039 RepID=UPI0021681BEC|nr:alpha/beta hydrolase [Bradyrhizobium centrosematis]MCS3765629.1 proline iminopeptidase [Bradyrhizobium centrosematis]MCS3778163.1 proline iminopeptidase [Bradyrhizobium centrosematis]